MRGEEQEEDREISGRETLRNGQVTVWQCATPRRKTEDAGDSLQPTFDVEPAPEDDDDTRVCIYIYIGGIL